MMFHGDVRSLLPPRLRGGQGWGTACARMASLETPHPTLPEDGEAIEDSGGEGLHDPRHHVRRQEGRGVRARRLGPDRRERAVRRRRRRGRLGRQSGPHRTCGERRHSGRRPARARLEQDRGAGAGARRAAHPSGAALVGRARPRHGGRGDRRHRAVLPGAACPCAGCAVRRHHRHQRQVDHDGADRPPLRPAPASTPSSAAISAPRSCRSRRPGPAACT